MNATIARLEDPTRHWMFEEPFIRATLGKQATRILTGAAAGLPEYPDALGIVGDIPVLAREVVALADGSMWLYADDVAQYVITPGSLGICHKCGDRGHIEGTFHVGWQMVVVEFAYCVGCMADHIAHATRVAAASGALLNVAAVRGQTNG